MLRRGGYEEAAGDQERLEMDLARARIWAERWAPESSRVRVLGSQETAEAIQSLDPEQREYLAAVAEKLEPGMGGDATQDMLYATAVERGLKPKRAFAAVYTALLGKKSGPKAGPFLAGLPREMVRERFSRV
jgi:lysyl-tRNA synthetase class 1